MTDIIIPWALVRSEEYPRGEVVLGKPYERGAASRARYDAGQKADEQQMKQKAKMQAVFVRIGRARWCLSERRKGRTFRSIGEQAGISGTRVHQICAKEERLERKLAQLEHLGEPD